MSELAKNLVNKATQAGKLREGGQFFSVTEKKQVDAGGGTLVTVEVPNGTHRVKILGEKIGKGKSWNGKEQEELQLSILDNGKQKFWNVPIKNEDGTLYYLIEDLQEIEVGEEFVVEAVKMKNGKYAKRISRLSKGADLPTVQLNDPASEGSEEGLGSEEGAEPGSDEDIPF